MVFPTLSPSFSSSVFSSVYSPQKAARYLQAKVTQYLQASKNLQASKKSPIQNSFPLSLNQEALDQIKPNCYYIGFTSGNGALAKVTKILTSLDANSRNLTATHAILVYANSNKELFVFDCALQQGGFKKQKFGLWFFDPFTKDTQKIFLYEAHKFISLSKL